jgi:G3E family GTPase
MTDTGRVPVTILTGFLGAGKTTLLNRILHEQHGRRIAVIENEFGPEGIDNEILVREAGEQIVEMNNGCLCCTIRGDLARTLGSLQERRGRAEIQFERVVIETTGMADPGPIVQTFFLDADVVRHYALDGVIAVVDAFHGDHTLDIQPEAQAQVGFADRLLLSKTDLADRESVARLAERIQRINPRAPVRPVHFGQAPIAELLEIGGFDLSSATASDPDFLETDPAEAVAHHHGDHDHHDTIASFVFKADAPLDGARLEQLMAVLAEGYGPDLMRYKGIVSIQGIDNRLILQGVQLVIGTEAGRPWARGEPRHSKIVFIGRDLDREVIIESLNRCLVEDCFDVPG